MQIRNFLRESFIDYPGKSPSCVVFVPGCNYHCPSCHAKHLLSEGKNIKEKEFFDYLDARKEWIEGIVVCGGEPTLQASLPFFLEKIKEKDLAIKLDTNGSHYEVLEDLLKKKLVDYVAMDVKAPSYLYRQATWKNNLDLRDDVEKGIWLVSQFPDYEFRTTLVPLRRNGKTSFMTIREVCDIAKWIVGTTGEDKHKYFLQPFVPRKKELLDSRMEEFPETPRELLESMRTEVRKYLPKCEIRGQ